MTLLCGLMEQPGYQVDAAAWDDMTGPVLLCQLSGGAVSVSPGLPISLLRSEFGSDYVGFSLLWS